LPPDLGFQGCRLPYEKREPSARQLLH
jgi:hypothetical protein